MHAKNDINILERLLKLPHSQTSPQQRNIVFVMRSAICGIGLRGNQSCSNQLAVDRNNLALGIAATSVDLLWALWPPGIPRLPTYV